LVNGGGFQFILPEKSQFLAFSPGKAGSKKGIKYNLKAAINHKPAKPAAILEPRLST
jgi:hypothetical protein